MSGKRRKVACVILAAGLSKRFGGVKQLSRLAPSSPSFVQNAVDVANGSWAEYVILVLGQSASDIAAKTKLGRANLVFNKEFANGLSTSVRSGLSNIPSDSEGAIFMVADQPFLTSEILDKMIAIYSEKNSKIIALTSSATKEPRNPVLFDRTLFGEFDNLAGDIGAKEIVNRNIKSVEFLMVDDPRIFLDIDTKDTLEEARRAAP